MANAWHKEGFDHIPKEGKRRRPGSKRPYVPLGGRSEGTRITDEAKEESEELVIRWSSKIVSETDRLVLADI